MNILYIGQFCPKSLLAKYPDKGLDTYKTSEFLIRGFRKREDVKLDIITAPDVGSYPKFPQVRFRRTIEDDGTIAVGFLNIPVVKQIMITQRLFNEACKIIERNGDKTCVILPYLVYHYVRVGRKLKQRYGDKVIISQTIPDIFFPKKWIHKRINSLAEKEGVKADCFVLFSKAMAEYLSINDGRYIVMESVIDGETYADKKEKKNDNDRLQVVYTGALGHPNGVGKLIEMMQLIKRDDFDLVITGRGALFDEFTKASKKDRRIRFMGTVPKADVFKYQLGADVLINPRSDNDAPTVTRYMFPSKLMEYMLTGNAVITCKMSGIPSEYYDYVYVSEDDTAAGIAATLNEVLDLSAEERIIMGVKARQYILENKTIQVQADRIVEQLYKYL